MWTHGSWALGGPSRRGQPQRGWADKPNRDADPMQSVEANERNHVDRKYPADNRQREALRSAEPCHRDGEEHTFVHHEGRQQCGERTHAVAAPGETKCHSSSAHRRKDSRGAENSSPGEAVRGPGILEHRISQDLVGQPDRDGETQGIPARQRQGRGGGEGRKGRGAREDEAECGTRGHEQSQPEFMTPARVVGRTDSQSAKNPMRQGTDRGFVLVHSVSPHSGAKGRGVPHTGDQAGVRDVVSNETISPGSSREDRRWWRARAGLLASGSSYSPRLP